MLSILLWIGIPVTILILGIILCGRNRFYNLCASFIAGGALALFLISFSWLICYTSLLGEIKEFEAIKSTIEIERVNTNISEYERAALAHEIIESNKWLASKQYWGNKTIFDMFYPDKINNLKPLR